MPDVHARAGRGRLVSHNVIPPLEIDRQVIRAVSFLGHMANGANVSSVVGGRAVRDVRIDRPPADSPNSVRIAGEATRRWLVESRDTAISAAASSWRGSLQNCEIRISEHERKTVFYRQRILTDNESGGRHRVWQHLMLDWHGVVSDVEGVQGVPEQAKAVTIGSHLVRVPQNQVVDQ